MTKSQKRLLLYALTPVLAGYAISLFVTLGANFAIAGAVYQAAALPLSLACLFLWLRLGVWAKKEGLSAKYALTAALAPGAVFLTLCLIKPGLWQVYFTPVLPAAFSIYRLLASFSGHGYVLSTAPGYILSLALTALCFAAGLHLHPVSVPGRGALLLPAAAGGLSLCRWLLISSGFPWAYIVGSALSLAANALLLGFAFMLCRSLFYAFAKRG